MMVFVGLVVSVNGHAEAEILEVPAYATPTVTSSTILQEGQMYVIEARGTYIYWGTGQKPADAEWYERAYEPGSWLEFSPDPCDDPSILDLLIDGTGYDWLGTTDGINFAPHVYSPSHVYRLYYVGEGKTIDLKIEDGSGANVLDNSGSLEVEITVDTPDCPFSEDFTVDPCWFSSVPDNIKWDPCGFYRARVTDNPGGFVQWGYSPTFPEVANKSFSIAFDMNPAAPCWGTYPLLAVIAEGVANPYIHSSLSVQAARAGDIDDKFVLYPGIGVSDPSFTIGQWYHHILDYDADNDILTWKISLVGQPDGSFYTNTYAGISVAAFNQVVVGYQGLDPVYGSWAEIYVDNIFVCVPAPADPVELLMELAQDVIDLNLHQGISNSLDAKLSAAMQALDDINENNDVAAINTLQAFINAVEAQRGDKIPEADADALIAAAQEIIDLVSAG
jgi:hypothetical protein